MLQKCKVFVFCRPIVHGKVLPPPAPLLFFGRPNEPSARHNRMAGFMHNTYCTALRKQIRWYYIAFFDKKHAQNRHSLPVHGPKGVQAA